MKISYIDLVEQTLSVRSFLLFQLFVSFELPCCVTQLP
jgi:hypothetical protein